MADNANARYAYQYLTAAGLSPEAATGVVGNLVVESGLNTRIKGDGGKATGLAQWHPDRFAALTRWARGKGLDPYSLDAQLGYVVVESKTGAGGYVWERLKSSRTVAEAAALFMRLFERPKDQSAAAARRRAEAGVRAVGDKSTISRLESGILDSLGDPVGAVTGAVVDPVVEGLQGAAGTVLEGLKPLIAKGAFALLAVGLIGAGLYQATRGRS